jgi:copper homeostasis protein
MDNTEPAHFSPASPTPFKTPNKGTDSFKPRMSGPSFELVCFDTDAVLLGCARGVDRLELCSQRDQEGLTPEDAMVECALRSRQQGHPRLMVMLRPDSDDTLCSEHKLKSVTDAVRLWKNEGVDGFVIGFAEVSHQTGNLEIAHEWLQAVMKLAPQKEWVFHRLVDRLPDPLQSLKLLETIGFRRILSSGGAPSAFKGWENLMAWQAACPGLELLAGGGLRSGPVQDLMNRYPDRGLWPRAGLHASCIPAGSDSADEEELNRLLLALKS